MLLERLLNLPVVLQQADVARHAVRALTDGAQAAENPAVDLARIRLAADGEAPFKAETRGDAAVHLVDLPAVALEKIHKARLGAGRAAAAEKAHRAQHEVQLLEVGAEILHPQRRALADRHRLGGLIVRIAKRGRRGIAAREGREVREHRLQLAAQIAQRVAV